MFYEKSCSQKFHKIHRKTPLPESESESEFELKSNIYFLAYSKAISSNLTEFC